MPVKIRWICETCGASGEVDATLPAFTLEAVTLEDAAEVTLAALQAVPHPHAVRPGLPAAC